jgi:hypothetical protein
MHGVRNSDYASSADCAQELVHQWGPAAQRRVCLPDTFIQEEAVRAGAAEEGACERVATATKGQRCQIPERSCRCNTRLILCDSHAAWCLLCRNRPVRPEQHARHAGRARPTMQANDDGWHAKVFLCVCWKLRHTMRMFCGKRQSDIGGQREDAQSKPAYLSCA